MPWAQIPIEGSVAEVFKHDTLLLLGCFQWYSVYILFQHQIPKKKKKTTHKQMHAKCDNWLTSPAWFIKTNQMCFTLQRNLHFFHLHFERHFEHTTKTLDVEMEMFSEKQIGRCFITIVSTCNRHWPTNTIAIALIAFFSSAGKLC